MKHLIVVIAAALVLTGGCRKQTTQTTSSMLVDDAFIAHSGPTPTQLGEIAAKIHKQPAEMQRILRDHGLTQPSFEQAVRKATADPKTQQQYAEAYKRGIV